ncbi:PaaI family thioesterase [Camelimonas sp. ID_303_24]
MAKPGATRSRIYSGAVDIGLAVSPDISRQHGFIHDGAIGAIADRAAGYAALSLTEPGFKALTTGHKINFAAPADSPGIVAEGRVIRSGRTLILVKSEVCAGARLVALVTGTKMVMAPRRG